MVTRGGLHVASSRVQPGPADPGSERGACPRAPAMYRSSLCRAGHLRLPAAQPEAWWRPGALHGGAPGSSQDVLQVQKLGVLPRLPQAVQLKVAIGLDHLLPWGGKGAHLRLVHPAPPHAAQGRPPHSAQASPGHSAAAGGAYLGRRPAAATPASAPLPLDPMDSLSTSRGSLGSEDTGRSWCF